MTWRLPAAAPLRPENLHDRPLTTDRPYMHAFAPTASRACERPSCSPAAGFSASVNARAVLAAPSGVAALAVGGLHCAVFDDAIILNDSNGTGLSGSNCISKVVNLRLGSFAKFAKFSARRRSLHDSSLAGAVRHEVALAVWLSSLTALCAVPPRDA